MRRITKVIVTAAVVVTMAGTAGAVNAQAGENYHSSASGHDANETHQGVGIMHNTQHDATDALHDIHTTTAAVYKTAAVWNTAADSAAPISTQTTVQPDTSWHDTDSQHNNGNWHDTDSQHNNGNWHDTDSQHNNGSWHNSDRHSAEQHSYHE